METWESSAMTCACMLAHSNTAAASIGHSKQGEGGHRRGTSQLCQRRSGTLNNFGQRGPFSAHPDKWLHFCKCSHTLISPAGFTGMPRNGALASNRLSNPPPPLGLLPLRPPHPSVCTANVRTAWARVGRDLGPLAAAPSPSSFPTLQPENSPAMRGPPM